MTELDPHRQRDFAREVARRLHEAGYIAYWAGGCVRDELLGLRPKDYDVATNALPEQVRELFGHRRTLAIGAAFGVIAVRGPRSAGMVEVTTFRTDVEYVDGRRPSEITFSSPEEDAQRRDFTINGLFYDPTTDKVLDFVGGRQDLEAGIIRAIGIAEERFREDKLRLLRAIRFAATFGFQLEAKTREAIAAMAAQITVVSVERIAMELKAMLAHPSRRIAVELLESTGLLAAILPELPPLAEQDPAVWEQTLAVLEQLAPREFPLALAALLLPAAPAEAGKDLAARVGRRLRLSMKEQQRVAFLLSHRDDLQGAAQQPWSRLQPLLISDGIENLLELELHRAEVQRRRTDHLELCRQKLALPPEELNPPPLLDGGDLIEHGVPRGQLFRVLLEALRTAQLDGQISDRQQALKLVDQIIAESEA